MKKALFFITTCIFQFIPGIYAQTDTPCSGGVPVATPLAVNATCTNIAGTTVGASAQTNANSGGTPSCGSMGPDVWYSIVAPATGNVSISTTAGSITDGVMAFYSGTCGSFTQLYCNDNSGFFNLMPSITATGLTPGATYFVRFWRYGGGTGTFSICAKELTPNVTCAEPTAICSGTPITFTANTGSSSASAINPGNSYGCLSTSPNPTWYYLKIATSGNLIVDISAGSDVDYAIWGPYTNLTTAEAACGAYPYPTGCSYSTSATEQVNVPGVTAGQVYVLLVTNYANTIQNISVNNAGGSATTDCSIVALPVGFSFWDVSLVGDDVILMWETESEQNNSHFLVQRSADGLIWETIGVVKGKGTSSDQSAYSYRDQDPIAGINYYRLNQIDTDGSSKLTSTLYINTIKRNDLKIFPNPAQGIFTVSADPKDVSEVYMTDIVGKQYQPKVSESGETIIVTTENTMKGIYNLIVTVKGERFVQRITLQ